MLQRNRVENEYERLLSGKYTKLDSPDISENSRVRHSNIDSLEVKSREDVERIVAGLRSIAERLGTTIACLCLAWLLKNQHVSSIVTGASLPEQLEENFKAIEVYKKLTAVEMEEIEKMLDYKTMPKPVWVSAHHAFAPMTFPPKSIQ